MEDLFKKFLITMQARNFAQSKIDHYVEDLKIFLKFADKGILEVQADMIKRGYSAGHVNKKIAAVKMFYIRTTH